MSALPLDDDLRRNPAMQVEVRSEREFSITSSAGGANFAEVAFAFRIAPAALGVGDPVRVDDGILGGLLPALKAARLPITSALRAG